MTIAAVVVTDLKNAIGRNNQLLCHLPADLKFFKRTTLGFPIIMGRKTYESIGRVLPGRRNLVITRSADYKIEGAEIYHSLEAALENCNEERIFIIGGAELYRESLGRGNRLYLTRVRADIEGDTFFPAIEWKRWHLVESEDHDADEKNEYAYSFETYERR